MGRDERPGQARGGAHPLSWLPLALFALAIWSIQRVVTKVALVRWSTARFYRWNALLSLAVYVPFAVVVPPRTEALGGALALSALMALTFWVTTEATRRGPVGVVAPLTATSPAITVLLAVALIAERPDALAWLGVGCAVGAAALLASSRATSGSAGRRESASPERVSGWRPEIEQGGWLALAVASLALQGVGAFIAKLVVTDGGPTTLLLVSAGVQLAVGLAIARREPLRLAEHARGAPLAITLTLAAAALATIGYLSALSTGPASLIVPFVATSPSLGGLLGVVLLRERASARQLAGIAFGLVGVVLLARAA